jgi:hypothetical protein
MLEANKEIKVEITLNLAFFGLLLKIIENKINNPNMEIPVIIK